MKYLALSLLLLAAPSLLAQEVWTLNAGAADVSRTAKEVVRENTATCAKYNLPASCTQTQARAAFCSQLGSSGPAPCTVNGESSAGIKIYSSAQDWAARTGLGILRKMLKDKHDSTDKAAFAVTWAAMTDVERDAWCVAHPPLEAGCTP